MENLAACTEDVHDARSARTRRWTRDMVPSPRSMARRSCSASLITWRPARENRESRNKMVSEAPFEPHSLARHSRIDDVDPRICRPDHRAPLVEGTANARRALAGRVSGGARRRAPRPMAPRRGFRWRQVVVRAASHRRARALRRDAPQGETGGDRDGVLRSSAAAGQTHGANPGAGRLFAERGPDLRLHVVGE